MRQLELTKDLTRNIKRGHAWLFSDAVERIDAPSGTPVLVLPRRGRRPIASGIYDPRHPLAVRICRTRPPWDLDEAWLQAGLARAAKLRRHFPSQHTTGFRLVAGEGDRLPGLIIDVYGSTAAVKLDGGSPEAFYDCPAITRWLQRHLEVECVVQRFRQRGREGATLLGPPPDGPVPFLENGIRFTAEVLRGQKTGFFLDQRDNRRAIRDLAYGRTVLNLFAYSGGFSVAAGLGGAAHVHSVDIAPRATSACMEHWTANGLSPSLHAAVTADCFEFLEQSVAQSKTWDLVISDPPSFAPSQRSRPAATRAYRQLAERTARVTAPGGLLALASCSSHIASDEFFETCFAGICDARREAILLLQRGLPVDHPTPAAMPELRYLKFLLYRMND